MRYAARFFESRDLKVAVVDRGRLGRSAIFRLLGPFARGPLAPLVESFCYSLLASGVARGGDLVVSNGFAAAFLRADVLFSHGSMRGARHAVKGRHLLWGPEELLELVAGRLARRVVAVSRKAGREWARLYGMRRDRIRVVPNCVDAAHFAPAPAAAPAAAPGGKAPLGPSASVRVLFVGRLEPRKGIDRLLRVARSAGGEFSFTVATPPCEGLEEFRGIGNLRLLVGVPMSDLPELYRSHDVFFFPSRYEGFEMVSLEALACGLPVVGTRVGGMAELALRGFPGVEILEAPDDAGAVLAALRRAAETWRAPDMKRRLHEATARDYGTEAWASALNGAIGDLMPGYSREGSRG